jgi:pyruvate/2-oxoglutarate/acetoin dehydrogenase E1 component
MPISEALMTGMAVGAAVTGSRPVVIWRNVTFSFVGFDQLANQAAKVRYMSGGQRSLPITFRCYSQGGERMAAQHSQSAYAIYAQFPGLKVVIPSNAADAYGLTRSAILDDDPVIVFEHSILDAVVGDAPPAGYVARIGHARLARRGEHLTIAGLGSTVPKALAAAEVLAREGIAAEVIDLRSAVPLDLSSVLESVARTGRLLVVEESTPVCSVASELAVRVYDHDRSHPILLAPIVRFHAANVPVPYAAVLEDAVLPSAEGIVVEARRLVEARAQEAASR